MAQPSGFTQRFKGKVTAAALWLGGSPQYGSAARVAYSTTAGSNGLAIGTLGLEAIASITASSALSIWQMSDLPVAGLRKTIHYPTLSSGAFLKAAAGASFDESTNTVIKSTYVQRISLLGLSSAKWTVTDVYPDTTAGGAPVGGITLSTTT